MVLQISSSQGPAECELAVCKLFDSLKEEFPDIELLASHFSKTKGCCSSILFSKDSDLSCLEGTVQWICRSPFRPEHKRKNWFVDVSIIPEAESISKEQDVKVEYFHCGGKGGQNVNKVETGVRLTHKPTRITVTSTAQRTQFQNRRDAMAKLDAILKGREDSAKQKQVNDAWKEHYRIERGNPVRVYKGMEFKREA